MASSAQSMSRVAVECVNNSICKFGRRDGASSGRYDCGGIWCVSKAPLIMRCEVAGKGSSLSSEASDFFPPRKLLRSNLLHLGCRKWAVGCSLSSPSGYDHISAEFLWEDLKPDIAYLTPDELELVHNALKLAFEAHDGQKRRSGEPFIVHPVEVARILGELELDWESIAAGLLHDTVEDTNVVTFERIEKEFGVTVRHIVEGETKVSKLGKLKCKNEISAVQDVKAHDLRQMFLAMTEEVRVIIVKLADRLHNMRTLSHMPPHKQTSIAKETLEVFAPLAKLLGMYQIKSELENLSFMYTNPQDYNKIKRRVAEIYKDHEKEIEEANKLLIKKIEDDQFLNLVALKTEVQSIWKEPYSIYKSVIKSKCSINKVNQIAQLRIIIKPKPCVGVAPVCNAQQICYHVLGLVHGIWNPIPRAMKDYIATPKPNGYQSLHTTVIPFLYESTFRLEVKIKTEEMNLIASRGIAAHYSGKVFVNDLVRHTVCTEDRNFGGKAAGLNNANVALRIGWLNAIREWQEEFVGNMSSREFVDTVTKDLLGSRVFVFTPRGEANKLLIKKIEDDQFLNLVALKTEVQSIWKEPYSIYKSVIKSNCSINKVNQIAQLRIIIKPKPCVGVGPLCNAQQICYHVLGLVHGIWNPVPRAMKDYIATPKPNGYQSLHTTVIPFLYESTFRLEVKIKTEEMNLIASRGIAAHYSGKVFVNDLVRHTVCTEDRNFGGKAAGLNNANVALRIGWLNAIREWQEEFVGNMSSREFVDTVTKDLLGSRVFVFTPRGEIKNLPKGATAIDYAYMIHTEIGNKMVAAKVNGNLVPPLHVLANAEVVEIVTYNGLSSKSAFQRHKQWLQHAKTRSARHKIMKFLREQAALSASEITADSVNEFLADAEEDTKIEEVLDHSKGTQHTWEKILTNVVDTSSSKVVDEDLFRFKNGSVNVPKVNGKHNKHMQHIGWLNAIREWQEEFVGNMSSREFVDTVTKDLLGSRVFVFTPRGEIKNLPKGATAIDYAYMIHTEIGNKMVAAKVNGNLVPPLHVLANAEVVEIVTYNGLSSKSAFQRHKQWLQHAKTRSARHKIMKFLREQAALSASEITADSVNEFLADAEEDTKIEEVLDHSKGTQHTWEKILTNVVDMSSSKVVDEDLFRFKNGSVNVPKVNGKHNKHMQHVSLNTGIEFGKIMFANIPMYKEVLPSLESWLAGKVASWSNLEGNSVQWLCIVCIDRKGMMADITIVLADAGIGICSCAAEVDRGRGMAVMLFHVEASVDNLVSACSKVDLVLGVLGWSTGCSCPNLTQNQQIREC
ncbi:HD/PDEase domain, RelA/SpoT family, Beta-grasp domain protein [Artemisia annua]|uniref:Putative GTP diphosphokinase RSH1, chloroplastic n=1 Tax=Artemisia annua TaxID=35608 RepID=A0A2U1QGB3_ARTAN|nr:HD/PDEase domain, RelA/SpoT family, Beta-grasp domain protein [Artemisia annua]